MRTCARSFTNPCELRLQSFFNGDCVSSPCAVLRPKPKSVRVHACVSCRVCGRVRARERECVRAHTRACVRVQPALWRSLPTSGVHPIDRPPPVKLQVHLHASRSAHSRLRARASHLRTGAPLCTRFALAVFLAQSLSCLCACLHMLMSVCVRLEARWFVIQFSR